jgi:trans-2,3-dihydro-3-hydroxyanthranilate isomerase
MKRRYVTADVFTKEMFGGNPLAVVLDAAGLSTAQMQAIALEFNYGETTFVLPPRDSTHTAQLRIFTARAEVPFAGHPNVGTAFLLARERETRGDPVLDAFVFEEAAGLVPLTLIRERGVTVGAELRAPETLSVRSQVSREVAAQCLSLRSEDIAIGTHPPQILSVGLPFLVVEVATRDALRAAKPNLTAYQGLLPLDGADGIYAYMVEDREVSATEAVLHARMFAPFDGALEDPATGSAAAATIARLAQLGSSATVDRLWRVHQGVDMGRPSLLIGRTVSRQGEVVSVHIGGTCVAVMDGTFTLAGDDSPAGNSLM